MKIFKDKRTKWLVVHEHYCQKKHTREKTIRRSKNKRDARKIVLTAPQIMSLKNNFKEVVNFFNELRKNTTGPRRYKRLTVDFEKIELLMPGAALILAAELYRWQVLYDIKLKPFHPNRWNNEVKRLFDEMGLFDLLNLPQKYKNTKFESPGSQTFFKFLTGISSDGETANRLMDNMCPVINSHYDERLLYVAISEAMTNVIQHAYTGNSVVENPKLKNRWWLSGSFDSDTKVMTVLLFDQGIGIPATLKEKAIFNDVVEYITKKKYSLTNHGRLIQAAVEIGKSRTKLGHRGKGLKQILKFSADSAFGSLFIVSRNGEYFFNEDCTEKTNSCPVELGGTFIQWEIRLQGEVDNGNSHNKDCRGLY